MASLVILTPKYSLNIGVALTLVAQHGTRQVLVLDSSVTRQALLLSLESHANYAFNVLAHRLKNSRQINLITALNIGRQRPTQTQKLLHRITLKLMLVPDKGKLPRQIQFRRLNRH